MPVSGIVLVRRPGSRVFARLLAGAQIPLGSTVDTTRGRVALTTSKDHSGHDHTGVFYAGEFRITQKPAGRSVLTVLTLTGAATCAAADGVIAKRRPGKRHARSLWGSASGGFSTTGKYASATERGTKWLTEDTCAGTLIRVLRGSVIVRDFPHRRSFLLRAPHSFLAHSGRGG
jgi:hypothetical protein